MKSKMLLTIATTMLVVAVLARVAAQDKYDLKVPGGLAFSEFRGYEDWAVIGIHHTDELMKLIVGNPVAIDAFRAGIPGNGKPFPDGSKMAKVEWRPKKSPDAPYDIDVPGAIYDLDFMVKDAKRFADSGGWGYAVFKQDARPAPTRLPTARTSRRRGMTPSVAPRATP